MTDKFTFNTSDELGKKIRELAESEFENLTQALIHITEQYLYSEKRYAPKEDACPYQYYLGESEAPPKKGKGWYCLKKSPKAELLGSGIIEAADKFCDACQTREGSLRDSKILKEQQTKGIVVMIPSCKRGAEVNEDMTKMYCPQIGAWRGIKERTKKKQYPPCREAGKNKSNCEWLKHTQTVIKGKLPEGQNL